ncbi:MAG: peptide deformylase [bacterium]
MPRLEVIKNPNPHLRRIATPVALDSITSKTNQKLVDDMILTMKKENGVGLAAVQVDVNQRLIVVLDDDEPLAIFNPELSNLSFAKVMSDEGCLSVPKVWGYVKRHRSLTWKGFDREGKAIGGRAAGFFAIVLQHEVDHLNGILFIDKVESYLETSNSQI